MSQPPVDPADPLVAEPGRAARSPRVFFGLYRVVGAVLPRKYRLDSVVDLATPAAVGREELTFLIEAVVYVSGAEAGVVGGIGLVAALVLPALWPTIFLVACIIAGWAMAAGLPWVRLKIMRRTASPLEDRWLPWLLDGVAPLGILLGVAMLAAAFGVTTTSA